MYNLHIFGVKIKFLFSLTVPCADKDPEQCKEDQEAGKGYKCVMGYYKHVKCQKTCGACPK